MEPFVPVVCSILHNSMWEEPPLTKQIWIWILIRARWGMEPANLPDGRVIRRGELCTSLGEMSDANAWRERNRLRKPLRKDLLRIVRKLERDGRIEIIETKPSLLLRVVNYSSIRDSIRSGQVGNSVEQLNTNDLQNDEMVGREQFGNSSGTGGEQVGNYKKKEKKSIEREEKKGEGISPPPSDSVPKSKPKRLTPRLEHEQAVESLFSGSDDLPEKFRTSEFEAAFREWAMVREQDKKWMTTRAVRMAIKSLAPYSEIEALDFIERSINGRWTGLVFKESPSPGHVFDKSNGRRFNGSNGSHKPGVTPYTREMAREAHREIMEEEIVPMDEEEYKKRMWAYSNELKRQSQRPF